MGCGASVGVRADAQGALQPAPVSASPAPPRGAAQSKAGAGKGDSAGSAAPPDDVSRAVARMHDDLLAATADVDDEVIQRTPTHSYFHSQRGRDSGSPDGVGAGTVVNTPAMRVSMLQAEERKQRTQPPGRGAQGRAGDGLSTSPTDTPPQQQPSQQTGTFRSVGPRMPAASTLDTGGAVARPGGSKQPTVFRFDNTKFRKVNQGGPAPATDLYAPGLDRAPSDFSSRAAPAPAPAPVSAFAVSSTAAVPRAAAAPVAAAPTAAVPVTAVPLTAVAASLALDASDEELIAQILET
jgi:hypothetical protein